ncbi:uncharacterized protein CBL_12394 [Carabus blaptoides fortunei]
MGKVFSILSRPVKNFNIESRAHKIISQDKPVPAPKHKASIEQAERILQENPDSLKELLKKDTTLDTHLKDVYVKSHDPAIDIKPSPVTPDRPLPLNRKGVEQFEFGFYEPINVAIGKCTLRQAVKFITNHQEDPSLWNSTKIAIDYKLPEDKIKNILHYFRVYKLFIPEKKVNAIFAGPSIPRERIGKRENDKMLNSGTDDKIK